MKPEQYKKWSQHPLRQLFSNLASGPDGGFSGNNSRAAIRAAVAEALPDDGHDVEGAEKIREAFIAKALEVVKAGVDRKSRFDLRQQVDQWIADKLDAVEKLDLVVQPEPELEPEDIEAALKATDRYSDMIGGDRAREQAREREEARGILRKAGYVQ